MGSHTILLKANILLLPIQDLRGKAATVAPVEHAVVMVLDQAGIFGQAFFEKGCAATVAPVDHAVTRGFDRTYLKSLQSSFF